MAKQYVVVEGYCSTQKKPLGMQCEVRDDGYAVKGSFLSSGGSGGKSEEFRGSFYSDGFRCRYCGNTGIIRCACGALFCGEPGAPQVTCPACGKTISVTWGNSIDVTARSNKQ